MRGGIALDLAAVVDRHHRLDLAAQGRQHEIEHILGALDDVGVREFLVEHDDVGARHALQRQMAVRIELDADHAFGADDRPRPLDDVAFDVVVAVRHHGAVQAEQQAVDRQRRLELAQDLVAHELVVGAVGRAGGAGGKAAALDQLEAFLPRRAPGRRTTAPCTCAARRPDARPAAGTPIPIVLEAGRQRREGVGLGRERGGEQAHRLSLIGLLSPARGRGVGEGDCSSVEAPSPASPPSGGEEHESKERMTCATERYPQATPCNAARSRPAW